MNFKKGDKVKFMGVDGVVVKDNKGGSYPIEIQDGYNFTSDGRYYDWQPSHL